MKIGFQGRFLSHPFTGIGQYSRALLKEFVKQSRHQFVVPTTNMIEEDFGPCVSLHFLKKVRSAVARHYFEQHLVPKFFQRQLVDLIHFPYPAHPWRVMNIPTVVTVHDVIPWIFPEYRQGLFSSLAHSLARRAIHFATHIITVSQFSKREIERTCGVPPEKISVIYNSCSEIYSKKSPEGSPALPKALRPSAFALYVGGYDQRKNVANLIQAFRRFSTKQPSAILVLVGRPNFSTPLYRQTGLSDLTFEDCGDTMQVAGIGNGGKIFRTNFLDEERLAVLYQNCRFFVHLSHYEGFNIPVLEAASSGAPLLLSDIPVHREIARDAAIFVDPDHPEEITDMIATFWNDTRLRHELITQGARVAGQFSWHTSAQEHLSLYESLCSLPPLSSSRP